MRWTLRSWFDEAPGRWLAGYIVVGAVAAGLVLATLLRDVGTGETGADASPSAAATHQGSPPPSASTRPTATPPAAPPSVVPTGAPIDSPSPIPTEVPPVRYEPVFAISPWSDIIAPFTTSLSGDGRLITTRLVPWDGSSLFLEERQLSSLGVSMVRDAILETGLFEESAEYWPIPLPGHELPGRGTEGYEIHVGTAAGSVRVIWSSVASDEVEWAEPSPDRSVLDELGSRLIALEEWLPQEAWLDERPGTYTPEAYRLFVVSQPWGGSLDDLPPEYMEVDWPLGGDLMTFGEPTESSWEGYRVHCGVLAAEDAQAVLDALADADAPFTAPLAERAANATDLGDRPAARVMHLVMIALHPHEDDCTGAEVPTMGW